MNKQCPFCFIPGECSISKEVVSQATDGNLTDQMWASYLRRINDNVVPECSHPEELQRAIQEANKLRG